MSTASRLGASCAGPGPRDPGPWSSPQRGSREAALGLAAEVRAALAADAAERDAAGADPVAEIALLRESGLLALMAPVSAGGMGAAWSTSFAVVRTVAEADPSIAQLLGYHWLNEATIGFVLGEAPRARWYRRSVEGRWFWADSVNPVDPELALTPVNPESDDPDAPLYLLDGLKRFASGAAVAEVILASAKVLDADGTPQHGPGTFVVVPADARGIEHGGDWDNLGQRLTASGSVRYTEVPIRPRDVLGVNPVTPFALLQSPGIQLSFANLYLGLATAALERGRELVLARRGAWPLGAVEAYRDDPFIQRLVGELDARLAAALALADVAGADFDRAAARGPGLGPDERFAVEIQAARVKIVATEIALDVAHRLYEATGASSTKTSVGFDRFWRNIRTHSLHDPVDYKKLEVGRAYLTGEALPPSLYT